MISKYNKFDIAGLQNLGRWGVFHLLVLWMCTAFCWTNVDNVRRYHIWALLFPESSRTCDLLCLIKTRIIIHHSHQLITCHMGTQQC
ncbi:hypothetical protein S83_006763 [Arachis hypogaea]